MPNKHDIDILLLRFSESQTVKADFPECYDYYVLLRIIIMSIFDHNDKPLCQSKCDRLTWRNMRIIMKK